MLGGEETAREVDCLSAVSSTEKRKQDLNVAQAASQGDCQAQRELAERLINRVRTSVAYLAPNYADKDDLAQRALLEVLRSAGSFRAESSLETWADRIATRTAMRLIKQRARQAEIVSLVSEPVDEGFHDGEEEARKTRLRNRLVNLLGRISPDRRNAVVLHFVHGYSVAEIAQMTEAPVNTVRDRLRIGKALLRKSILLDPVLCSALDGEGKL